MARARGKYHAKRRDKWRKRDRARKHFSDPSYNADSPVAGCYRTRLVKNGPPVALRIWFGPPFDPETGEELDRSPRWLCQVNGQGFDDVFRFWPHCAFDPISPAEHNHICARARTMDPSDPYFDPTKPIDRRTTPVPF